MERKLILKIDVNVREVNTLQGMTGSVTMVPFTGSCHTEYFHGEVLSGGVDTQMEWYPAPKRISARYMLSGTDSAGTQCRIFVENNGDEINGRVEGTRPQILTDSKELSWLETAQLSGTLTPTEEDVIVRIFAEV